MSDVDVQYMTRAIRMAMHGRGRVEPNPMVGCVFVKNYRVIGEAHTSPFGGPHAEPNALAACNESPEGATAYVTLEPCCDHPGKKTPACAPRLLEAKIARVVYGCLDPNPGVNGKSIEMLKAAGVEVVGPVLEDQTKQLIAPFIKQINFKRPYVTMKWAVTADGKVAGPGGKRIQISNERSTRRMHELRARCDAILVSSKTIANDDPMLTARDVDRLRPLLRCVLDRDLSIPLTAKVVQQQKKAQTIIYCDTAAIEKNAEKAAELKKRGVILSTAADGMVDLHERGVTHVLVEPGPTMAQMFFKGPKGAVDRVWIFKSPNKLNDPEALDGPKVPKHYVRTGKVVLSGGSLSEYLNPDGDAFFSASQSADFVLTYERK